MLREFNLAGKGSQHLDVSHDVSKFWRYLPSTFQILYMNWSWSDNSRSSHPEVFWKKAVLKNLDKNTCTGASFLIKLNGKVFTVLKRNLATCIFLWILLHFLLWTAASVVSKIEKTDQKEKERRKRKRQGR